MWVIVYLGHNGAETEKIKQVLEKEGIMVKVRKIGKAKEDDTIFEILVPKEEVDFAHEIIGEMVY